MKRDLPVLRSTFLPLDNRGGTRIFLFEEPSGFLVATRFEEIGRRKLLEDAIKLFEYTLTEDKQ